MIDGKATATLGNPNLVVLLDEFGPYTTSRNRLDNGLADPNRFAENRLDKLFEKTKKEKA
jgi:hypothetical protein